MGFNPYLNSMNVSSPAPITNLIHSLPNLTAQPFLQNESCLKRSSLPETKTDLYNQNNSPTGKNYCKHQISRSVDPIKLETHQTNQLKSNTSNLTINSNSSSDGISKTNQSNETFSSLATSQRVKNNNQFNNNNTGSISNTIKPTSTNSGYVTINYTISNDYSNGHKAVGICQNTAPSVTRRAAPPLPAAYFNIGLTAPPPPVPPHHPSHMPMSATSFAVASLAAAVAAAAANGICNTLPHQTNAAVPLTSHFPLALAEPHAYFQAACKYNFYISSYNHKK